MLGLHVLDIALGLIFVYLLLSIICTAANELIAGLFKLRAKNLAKGIGNLLGNRGVPRLEESFYDHPLIRSLYKHRSKPSYIPPRVFAMALLDLIAPVKEGGVRVMADIRAEASKLPRDADLRKTLLILMDEAGDSVKRLQHNIEMWFDDSMDRVAGW